MRDQLQVPAIVQLLPGGDGFGRETAIGKGEDQRRARAANASHVGEYQPMSPKLP